MLGFEHSYKDTTWSAALNDLFSKDDAALQAYIQEGREFWFFDNGIWKKLKVTYVRSGVMFFVFENEPEKEKAWFLSSFNAVSLVAAQIYVDELSAYYEKKYNDCDFPKICSECKWQTFNDKITVDVIWE